MADHDDEEQFEAVGAGSAQYFPMQCSSLRKNGFVLVKGFPCKIVDMSTSKTGKHGHAKVHLVGLDIFTNQKKEDICPSTHNMNVPHVSRTEWEVTDIDENCEYLTLMNDQAECREDLKLLDSTSFNSNDSDKAKDKTDMWNDLRGGEIDESVCIIATVLKAMGKEVIKDIKKKAQN